ncbi:ribosomal L1 domain-containing protein 1 isoform X2 [Narcine bancroftii]|uniref:ribosomal L1 domain-containing protein 1 isoform X2 n=1 Tax=Narcine bancroftii TaxID=1343680 RepID=UPI00383203CB
MAAEKQGMETVAEVDSEQIYKAVKALMEYVKKTKNDTKLFLNEDEIIMLCVTVWEIPSQEQKIKIALPHEIRSETVEICLFTKDEPNMNADETQKFYQKLLNEHNIKNITHIIPYKSLKTEYKPYEAKRRLLSTFDVFLADDRIRRLLPSHLGKHFYRSKKIPLSVNLASNDLAKDLCKMIQGTVLPVNNRGSCYSSRVAHTGMKLGEIVENVIAAIHTIGVKLPQQWKNVKILHLKTLNSPALPIYTSDMCNLEELQKKKSKKHKETKKAAKVKNLEVSTDGLSPEASHVPVKAVKENSENTKPSVAIKRCVEEEEIPQLVPIEKQTPAKKAKLQKLQGQNHNIPKVLEENETPVGKKLQQIKCKQTPKVKTPNKNQGSPKVKTSGKKRQGFQTPRQEVKEHDLSLERSSQKKTERNPRRKSIGIPNSRKTPKQKPKPEVPKSV